MIVIKNLILRHIINLKLGLIFVSPTWNLQNTKNCPMYDSQIKLKQSKFFSVLLKIIVHWKKNCMIHCPDRWKLKFWFGFEMRTLKFKLKGRNWPELNPQWNWAKFHPLLTSQFQRISKTWWTKTREVKPNYSSVPNRCACMFINFEKKFPPAWPYFGLQVYWFCEKNPPCAYIQVALKFKIKSSMLKTACNFVKNCDK